MTGKEIKSKCGCCFGSLCKVFYLCFAILFLAGGLVLGIKAVPDLKRYLDEERHHVNTLCTFQYTEISEVRDCTYEKDCGNGCSKTVKNSYPCYQVYVTFKDKDDSVIQAKIFESFKDAERTEHECTTYSCRNPNGIQDFVNELQMEKTFDCFHDPGKLHYVYIYSAIFGH